MNKATSKVLSLLLAIIMLLSCISCEKNAQNNEYDENKRLEITNEPPTYSEEFIERAAISFADIGEALVLRLKNVKVTQEQKKDLRNYFKTEIFPIIVMARIYSSEVDTLFSATLEFLSGAAKARGSFEIFANLYKTAITSLDATRAGVLAFEFSKAMILDKADECRKRYEKYGYKWYLDDALKYEALKKNLTDTLGRDKFITASSIIFFALSSVYGIGMPKNELGLSVNGKEALCILEMQADFFKDSNITDADWEIFAALLTELVPSNSASHINAELYALKKDNYFVSLSKIMTPLLDFYEAATNRLSENGASIYLADGSLNMSAVITAALGSEAELNSLLDSIELYAKTSSKAEADAVSSMKLTESYEEFTASHSPISKAELISALHSLTDSQNTAQVKNELYRLLTSYAVGIAPYLTFSALNS